MPTTTRRMLRTIDELLEAIKPGVSGWQPSIEGQGTRDLITAAQVTIAMPVPVRREIRRFLIDRILVDVGAQQHRPHAIEKWETSILRGEYRPAMEIVQASLQAQDDDEQAEEPG